VHSATSGESCPCQAARHTCPSLADSPARDPCPSHPGRRRWPRPWGPGNPCSVRAGSPSQASPPPQRAHPRQLHPDEEPPLWSSLYSLPDRFQVLRSPTLFVQQKPSSHTAWSVACKCCNGQPQCHKFWPYCLLTATRQLVLHVVYQQEELLGIVLSQLGFVQPSTTFIESQDQPHLRALSGGLSLAPPLRQD